jgi:micrococcal nuclease
MLALITKNKSQITKCFFLFHLILLLIFTDIIAQTQAATVQRVIDGDTFVLANGEKVRLLGVDTPELNSKIHEEKALADSAANLLTVLILTKNVRLEYDGPVKDIFSRTLSYVFLQSKSGKDSLFIQAELLKKGLARILMYPKQRRYYGLFYNLRNTARRKHLGIWSK